MFFCNCQNRLVQKKMSRKKVARAPIIVIKSQVRWSRARRLCRSAFCVRAPDGCHDAERKLQAASSEDGRQRRESCHRLRVGPLDFCCRRVSGKSGMKAHSGEVGVFVRIRPTANFSPDLIECLPDGQVTARAAGGRCSVGATRRRRAAE